jgi:hypothetical protein
MAIAIYDKAKGTRLFEISSEQRDQLVAALEEEDEHDHDYYVDAAVCDFLDGKIDAALVGKLRDLIGAKPAAAADAEGLERGSYDDPPPPELAESEDGGIEIEWREE